MSQETQSARSWWQMEWGRWGIFALVFLGATFVQYLLFEHLPIMDVKHREAIKIPHSLEDLKDLEAALSHYMEDHHNHVYLLFIGSYIYLQAFALPGSAFLAILSGALFESKLAVATVCMSAGIGSSFCYLISWILGDKVVQKYFGERIQQIHDQMDAEQGDFFSYILFLRITPFLPNWFISVASPHLNVPIISYFFGTVFGVVPLTLLHVQAGLALQEISSMKELSIFNPRNLLMVIVLGFLSLVPVAIRRFRQRSTAPKSGAEVPKSDKLD